ncbi:PD-(D/E)XK motif protein [Flavobacteriaceae bacterium]|nr:PD-(D/E)XK motif protein [Flavobacteriaceae bacterium]
MDVVQLENQWSKLTGQQSSGFITLKIDAGCKPDLDLGLNKEKHRCLLLRLPVGVKSNFRGETKENLKTLYNKKENCIVLELLDEYYYSLFNDLIISLFYKIKDIEDNKEYISVFVSTINKWAAFLANTRNNRLTEDVVKGLFGELTVLYEFLKTSSKLNIDSILNSWQGPYDANTDFIFDDKNIEVKTKSMNSPEVKISSEYQLDDELGKSLELTVVSVEIDFNSTSTLESLINLIRSRILELSGDLSILLEALAQKSLFSSNLKEYNNYSFTLKQHDTFDCNLIIDSEIVFPRLMKSQLPENIGGVKYSINLAELNNFIIKQKMF